MIRHVIAGAMTAITMAGPAFSQDAVRPNQAEATDAQSTSATVSHRAKTKHHPVESDEYSTETTTITGPAARPPVVDEKTTTTTTNVVPPPIVTNKTETTTTTTAPR